MKTNSLTVAEWLAKETGMNQVVVCGFCINYFYEDILTSENIIEYGEKTHKEFLDLPVENVSSVQIIPVLNAIKNFKLVFFQTL